MATDTETRDPRPEKVAVVAEVKERLEAADAAVLTDYGKLAPGQRNILRLIFGDPRVRAAQYDWESVARFVVGAFRADAARAGAVSEVSQLVDELCRLSPEFEAMWRDNNVNVHGEGIKRLRHPILGR